MVIDTGIVQRLLHRPMRRATACPFPEAAFSGFLRTLFLAGTLAYLAMPAARGADNQPPPGFVALFNGRDFSGWKVPEGDGGHWKVVDGVIDYDAESEAKGDKSLWTERQFGDLVLHRGLADQGGPLHEPQGPLHPARRHSCQGHPWQGDAHGAAGLGFGHLCSAADGNTRSTSGAGRSAREKCTATAPTPKQPPEVRAAATPRTQADKPVGEWNHFEITLRGDRVTVHLNGIKVIDNARMPGIPPQGPIGLQHHGAKRDGKWSGPPALLQFRNIYLKEL